MSGMAGSSISSVPNGQIIDFERAELRRVPFQDSLYLWVSGRLPGPDFEARLAPRLYHGQPEYWGIEVAAIPASQKPPIVSNDNDPLMFEYSVPLVGITGSRGITVIGASQSQRIEIGDGSF